MRKSGKIKIFERLTHGSVQQNGGGRLRVKTNDGFCGVVAAMGRDGKACSVQLGGLVRVPYSGETAPAVGWNLLAADGNGGVSVVTSGGHSYLAVEVDTTGKTMTIML